MTDASMDTAPERRAIAWVRSEPSPALPAPVSTSGPVAWVRANLFSGPVNIILTLASLYVLWVLIPPLVTFFWTNATFTGATREACLPNYGACYPYLTYYFPFFMYGFYPEPERWRPNMTLILGIVGIVGILWQDFRYRNWAAVYFFFVYPVIAFFLLSGGYFGLPQVPTDQWGGVIVTLVVAVTGIVFSLPLGILLALGRRSRLPVVKFFSVLFIEFWRGVPLVSVLFMASLMLPLFMPPDNAPDKLVRALVGVALFSAAYMAEVVRGGLQAIPKGQYEGAQALGLDYTKMMAFIVLPQALKLVIPGIVNSFIGLFKDTSLVFIVGLIDFLRAVETSLTNPLWATPFTRYSGYAFAAIFYFLCCWGMSLYSRYLENRLDTGHKR
jgi:general L-amino acid transport system permease protein